MASYPCNSPYTIAEKDVIRSLDLNEFEQYIITENVGSTKMMPLILTKTVNIIKMLQLIVYSKSNKYL
jgi:hypothetical protein